MILFFGLRCAIFPRPGLTFEKPKGELLLNLCGIRMVSNP